MSDENETNKVETEKIVSPNEDVSNEETPIGDAVAAELGVEIPSTAEHADKTDVPAALQRETHDGKGDEDPGPSDWNGYATEGVEVQEDSK